MNTNYDSIELDLESFEKRDLINLILYAHKHNLTFNDAITKAVSGIVNEEEKSTEES